MKGFNFCIRIHFKFVADIFKTPLKFCKAILSKAHTSLLLMCNKKTPVEANFLICNIHRRMYRKLGSEHMALS